MRSKIMILSMISTNRIESLNVFYIYVCMCIYNSINYIFGT